MGVESQVIEVLRLLGRVLCGPILPWIPVCLFAVSAIVSIQWVGWDSGVGGVLKFQEASGFGGQLLCGSLPAGSLLREKSRGAPLPPTHPVRLCGSFPSLAVPVQSLRAKHRPPRWSLSLSLTAP